MSLSCRPFFKCCEKIFKKGILFFLSLCGSGKRWLDLDELNKLKKVALGQDALNTLPKQPYRLLLLRLDARLGNAIMLTPLLDRLKQSPLGKYVTIDVVVDRKNASWLKHHPGIDHVWAVNRRRLFGRHGLWQLLFWMRQQRYAMCMDVTNVTEPSLTQAFLCRFSRAGLTVGPKQLVFQSLYHYCITGNPKSSHEITLRMHLLDCLGFQATMRLPDLSYFARLEAQWLLDEILPMDSKKQRMVVLYIGARLLDKRLSWEQYLEIIKLLRSGGYFVVLAYGPQEAKEIDFFKKHFQKDQSVILTPLLSTVGLGQLFQKAHCVISCDTGPMHLAVAMQTPTCGLFVSTPIERYGYNEKPHRAIDVRTMDFNAVLQQIHSFLVVQSSDFFV